MFPNFPEVITHLEHFFAREMISFKNFYNDNVIYFVVKKPPQPKQPTPVKADAGEYVDVYEPPPEVNTSDDYWDEFEDTIYDRDDDEASVASGHVFNVPLPAVVLYDYTAASPDELSIVENEEVEVMEKDGEGWCKVSKCYK